MVEFAVWHEGMAEGTGRWVLAVDPSEDNGTDGAVLLCDEADNSFYWQPLDACKLVRAKTPDMPTPVVAIEMQPQQSQQAGLVLPKINRQMRRDGGF